MLNDCFELRFVFHTSAAYNFWDLNADIIVEIIGQPFYFSYISMHSFYIRMGFIMTLSYVYVTHFDHIHPITISFPSSSSTDLLPLLASFSFYFHVSFGDPESLTGMAYGVW